MFGFLNSFLLPALSAALLPLLLHLWNRRKTRKVPFSSLRFLQQLQNQRVRQLKVYQLLLVLVRMLFIFFLVLSFTRPTLNARLLSSNPASTAVYLLDDSYSMRAYADGKTLFRHAQDALLALLPALKPDDATALLTTSGDFFPEINASIINRLQPTYQHPNWKAGLEKSRQYFSRHKNVNRELYVLSDGQIAPQQWPDSLAAELSRVATVFLINPLNGREQQNASIDTAFADARIVQRNQPFTVTVNVTNHNLQSGYETRLHLFAGQRRLAVQRITLEPGQQKAVSLNVAVNQSGTLKLSAELDEDDLGVDNRFYFLLTSRPPLRVAYWASPPQPLLTAALSTLSAGRHIALKNLLPGARPGDSTNVLLVAGLNGLQTIASPSHPLVFFPGPGDDPAQLNTLFKQLYGIQPFSGLRTASGADTYFAIRAGEMESSDLKDIRAGNPYRQQFIRIQKYFPLSGSVANGPRISGEHPLYQVYKTTSAKTASIVACAASIDWSDLPLQGIFLPLLEHLLENSSGLLPAPPPFVNSYDQNILVSGDLSSGPLTLLGAEDNSIVLAANPAGNELRISLPAGVGPGFYTIIQDRKKDFLKELAINADRREISAPAFDFQSAVPGAVLLNIAESPLLQVESWRKGSELWFIFALFALCMLFFELLLVRKIEGKERIVREST